jgi:hypothetical protein
VSWNRLQDMGVVGDAKLIWDSQQQGVGLGDGLVFPELLDDHVRLGSIASPEDRPSVRIDEADLVFILPLRVLNRHDHDRP